MLLIAVAYALLGKLMLSYFSTAGNVTLVWFPGGMALAILLLKGIRFWPGVFIGAFAAGLLVKNEFWLCFFIALGNTLESVSAAWLLNRYVKSFTDFNQRTDLGELTLIGAGCACISALFGVGALWQFGVFQSQAVPDALLHWWMADVFGIISTTPVLLIWRFWPTSWFQKNRILETLGFNLILIGVALVVFLDFFQEQLSGLPHAYWMFVLMIWGAMRFGRHGVQWVSSVTVVTALLGAASGKGYFADDFEKSGLLNYWLFQALFSWIGTKLALTLHDARQSNIRLRSSEQQLQAIIDTCPVAYLLTDNQQKITLRNPAFIDTFGYTQADIPAMADWWGKAFPNQEYRQWAEDSWQQAMQKVGQSGHSFDALNLNIRCKNGEMRHVQFGFGQLIGDHAGAQLMTLLDLTSQVNANKALQQKELNQRALLDNFPFAVWLKDADSRYMAINQVFADRFAVNINQIVGKSDLDIFPVDVAEGCLVDDQQVMTSGQQQSVERELEQEGKCIWLELYKAPLFDERLQVMGTVGFARDITERKASEEALKLAALVFENSSEAMLVTDADNIILNVNAAFINMTGYSREYVLGKDPKILGSGEQSPAFYQAMWQSIHATGSWHGEITNRRKNGELYVEEITINTIFDADGRPQRRVALFSDITQRKLSEEQIWQQANFDPLTGLPNRSLLRERMGFEIKKAHRMQQRFAVLFIDLDRFKEVNDTLGHEIGDELLKQAAQRLLNCVRESDTVARLGGDEFTIILADMDSVESPERVVKQLVEQLSMPFALQHEQVYVSASVGITLYPDDGQTLSQLLKNADQAMYAAKNNGRNCYSFFTPSMQAVLTARAAMLNDLRGALAKQEFKLVYQPIVDLASGQVYKAEALLRWLHPERGLVSPVEFVPLAEDSGLINEIGDWVFHSAINQLKSWRKTLHPEFQISINKSPVQFLDVRHQPADWIHHIQAADLPGQALVVEITEGLLLEASKKTAEHLLVFRDAGVQVAIDDFGTGYSALSYLKKFDIDYLKIDQSFVRNLNAESSDFVLCEAIIVMAHKLGLKVIAEGVETELQRDLLKSVACDFGQGYLFARPMPAEEFAVRYNPDNQD